MDPPRPSHVQLNQNYSFDEHQSPHQYHHRHRRNPSSASVSVSISTEPSGAEQITTPEPRDGPESPRKKQKRNKPTLSCAECAERKTKCDRGRPICLACTKRGTECKYAPVANIIEETYRSAVNGRRMTKPPKKKFGAFRSEEHSYEDDNEDGGGDDGRDGNNGSKNPCLRPVIPNIADRAIFSMRSQTHGSVALSTGLLSQVPYSLPTASNVFGIGSEHPFANYWTINGGLPEVIEVLPNRAQADILLQRYFECVDPVYPMIHRLTFYADYEQFWSHCKPQDGTNIWDLQNYRDDAAFVALLFAMLALGTQFVTSRPPSERRETAEFYASASNQALRIGSYLSTASIRSIQAMVLVTYFLVNDNHASDGWAFAGILIRQAYAMGLHRDPNIVTPNASIFEKQQRRKLWQAVLLQDTFLTVLLSLPPSATHTDVKVSDLEEPHESIAHSDPTDVAYIRCSWTLANLVQEKICSQRSLDLPICTTPNQKARLTAEFRAVFRSFPEVFRAWDAVKLAQRAESSSYEKDGGAGKRIVRQTLFLTSNYHHNLMLVHACENEGRPGEKDTRANLRLTVEAAHDAIGAFFLLFQLFSDEAPVWWVFNHRAFLEALCIGAVLREVAARDGLEVLEKDPLFLRAKEDITRMIETMQIMGDGENGSAVARTRVEVLQEYLKM